MGAGSLNLYIDQGSTFNLQLSMFNYLHEPVDMWSTEDELPLWIVRAYIRQRYSSDEVAVRLTVGNGNIEFQPNEDTGIFTITLGSDDTDLLDFRSGVWDLEMVPVVPALCDEIEVPGDIASIMYDTTAKTLTAVAKDVEGVPTYPEGLFENWSANDIILLNDAAPTPDVIEYHDLSSVTEDDNARKVLTMKKAPSTSGSTQSAKLTQLYLDETAVIRLAEGIVIVSPAATKD